MTKYNDAQTPMRADTALRTENLDNAETLTDNDEKLNLSKSPTPVSAVKNSIENTKSSDENSQDAAPNYDYPWWQGAIIYQVYPRSFCDANDDGIGDIQGIIAKLDYIEQLGVDAIWVSPVFKSPMKDFGYDISDYRSIDPIFGSLKDFDELIEKAHARGLKIMIDQVLSHTSDQHAWFQESRQDKTNAKADWYVWADPKEDGAVPNNWLSVFGGSAWEWDEQRQQYFLHNFLNSQPDLNFHCAELRTQILAEVEFWLKRGVDGLRLDAINFCFHDKNLRDNPLKPESERKARGFSKDNPYAHQYHVYDNTQDENLDFIRDLRALLDKYPGVVSLGEINSDDSLKTIAEYTRGSEGLHLGYSFELLADECSPIYIKDTVEKQESHIEEGWPCWSISNHDVTRVLSRWGDGKDTDLAKTLTALACTLRGAVCTYQGEELGLSEAPIERHEVQDPFGIRFWPEFKGRDGCRTPMPWQKNTTNLGFSSSTPWLPLANDHAEKAVDVQSQDKDSVLNWYKHYISCRKSHPALRWGDIRFLHADNTSLSFLREHSDETILAAFNFGEQEISIPVCETWNLRPLDALATVNANEMSSAAGAINLTAYSAVFFEVSR